MRSPRPGNLAQLYQKMENIISNNGYIATKYFIKKDMLTIL